MSLGSTAGGQGVEVVGIGEVDPAATPPTPAATAVRIPVNGGPIGDIAVSPDGTRLLLTHFGNHSVSVIDTDAGRVVQAIPGIAEPYAVAAAGDSRAYVSTVLPSFDAIQVIDVEQGVVVATHPVALSVSDLAAGADGKHLFVSRNSARGADVAVLDADDEMNLVEVIDIATTAGTATECVRVSPDGTRLYVGINGPSGGQLVVIDTGAAGDRGAATNGRSRRRGKNTKPFAAAGANRVASNRNPAVIDTIDIGLPVRDVAVSPNGARVYVASSGPDFAVVDVVHTASGEVSATRKISEISGLLTRLALSADGDRAYLVGQDGVTVLCTLTQDLIRSIDLAAQPSCVAESPDGRHLYIADHSGRVSAVRLPAPVDADVHQSALETRSSAELFVPETLHDPALV
ncbi:YncE family protein [Mycobacterium sp.]|uniref:YncE family protein n=1 Tax=Mycobacterium sp. TaxID=1785 RepID=UPI003A8C2C32